ncbi:hypothetical protein [Candidatus Poriferisocius sp.]|uniref:hypothetical protein n=1 Tax=Candidatus Poriferisocius sp. TaxID=3101276 RepID=UPI003B028233
MGWLRDRKEKRARKAREAQAAREARDRAAREKVRERERERLESELAIANDISGAYDESDGCPIVLKKNEQVIGIIEGTGLVEVKAGKTQYRGGSAGTSIRVAKGVSLRVGQHKGTVYREPEMPRLLCTGGAFVVTDMRAVYVGPKYTREFAWNKTISMTESTGEGGACLLIAVNNRQKVSGVLTGSSADAVAGRCEIGIAISNDNLPQLVAELESEIAALGEESEQRI